MCSMGKHNTSYTCCKYRVPIFLQQIVVHGREARTGYLEQVKRVRHTLRLRTQKVLPVSWLRQSRSDLVNSVVSPSGRLPFTRNCD
jgi:hypothetical protein